MSATTNQTLDAGSRLRTTRRDVPDPWRRRRWAGLAALRVTAGLTGGAAGAAAARSTDNHDRTAAPAAATGLDIHAVLAAVKPAVVQVVAGESTTGFVVSADGEVLTNSHVVSGQRSVRVRLSGEATARSARIIGDYPEGDVALLKIDDANDLPTGTQGSVGGVRVGDDVIAIGFALGLSGEPTVTRGIVSAKDRSLEQLTGLIQTDTPINRGNSGGPLVNGRGEIIGINTLSIGAGVARVENLGFAIPIDDAVAIAAELRSGRQPTSTAFLGVSTRDARTGDLGAEIEAVVPGSAAAIAGLRPGDVIVAVDGEQISGPGALGRTIRSKESGTDIALTVLRDRQTLELVARIGARNS